MSDKLSEIMRAQRATMKLTKIQMAKKLKCSVHVMNHLEGSKYDPIGAKTIETLHKTFKSIARVLNPALEKRNKVAKAYYKELLPIRASFPYRL